MSETADYANSPADIREVAQQIASTYDFDRSVLAGAICAAILAERERAAKIAEGFQCARCEISDAIASSIRSPDTMGDRSKI